MRKGWLSLTKTSFFLDQRPLLRTQTHVRSVPTLPARDVRVASLAFQPTWEPLYLLEAVGLTSSYPQPLSLPWPLWGGG